jgi:hypothetical protein
MARVGNEKVQDPVEGLARVVGGVLKRSLRIFVDIVIFSVSMYI